MWKRVVGCNCFAALPKILYICVCTTAAAAHPPSPTTTTDTPRQAQMCACVYVHMWTLVWVSHQTKTNQPTGCGGSCKEGKIKLAMKRNGEKKDRNTDSTRERFMLELGLLQQQMLYTHTFLYENK